MKRDLIDIIKALKKTRADERLKVSDEVLFQEAVRIFNTRFITNKKKKSDSEPATEKQIDLLYKLNADFNAETITKEEAKKLISKLLEKEEKNIEKRE